MFVYFGIKERKFAIRKDNLPNTKMDIKY